MEYSMYPKTIPITWTEIPSMPGTYGTETFTGHFVSLETLTELAAKLGDGFYADTIETDENVVCNVRVCRVTSNYGNSKVPDGSTIPVLRKTGWNDCYAVFFYGGGNYATSTNFQIIKESTGAVLFYTRCGGNNASASNSPSTHIKYVNAGQNLKMLYLFPLDQGGGYGRSASIVFKSNLVIAPWSEIAYNSGTSNVCLFDMTIPRYINNISHTTAYNSRGIMSLVNIYRNDHPEIEVLDDVFVLYQTPIETLASEAVFTYNNIVYFYAGRGTAISQPILVISDKNTT